MRLRVETRTSGKAGSVLIQSKTIVEDLGIAPVGQDSLFSPGLNNYSSRPSIWRIGRATILFQNGNELVRVRSLIISVVV
jgi:hypothetical protein